LLRYLDLKSNRRLGFSFSADTENHVYWQQQLAFTMHLKTWKVEKAVHLKQAIN
jgi:hypothetical protein